VSPRYRGSVRIAHLRVAQEVLWIIFIALTLLQNLEHFLVALLFSRLVRIDQVKAMLVQVFEHLQSSNASS
jgi:hypothetical protein